MLAANGSREHGPRAAKWGLAPLSFHPDFSSLLLLSYNFHLNFKYPSSKCFNERVAPTSNCHVVRDRTLHRGATVGTNREGHGNLVGMPSVEGEGSNRKTGELIHDGIYWQCVKAEFFRKSVPK